MKINIKKHEGIKHKNIIVIIKRTCAYRNLRNKKLLKFNLKYKKNLKVSNA